MCDAELKVLSKDAAQNQLFLLQYDTTILASCMYYLLEAYWYNIIICLIILFTVDLQWFEQA